MRDETLSKVRSIEDYLRDHKCGDVQYVDISEKCDWTEAFVIATVDSVGHLRGVVKNIWEKVAALGLTVNSRHKTPEEDVWTLIDCNDIVIHLMNSSAREFYGLEKLWEKEKKMKKPLPKVQ